MSDTASYFECIAAYTAFCERRIAEYASLIEAAKPILEIRQQTEMRHPPNFNIFFALGHAYREVSTHSAMLAHLLEPTASHEQGVLFLRAFLSSVQQAASRQKKTLAVPIPENSNRWHCRREVPLPNGQADILIRGPQLILIIENKVYAADQINQLKRYWSFAKGEAQRINGRALIVYLTPNGRMPSDLSMGDEVDLRDNLVCLSYHEDIREFIENTGRTLRAISVGEVLRQYAALVSAL